MESSIPARSRHVSPKALNDLPAGARGVVRGLLGGRQFVSRVAVLGFTAGAGIEVVQNYGRGPVIVALRDTRVALGRGEAAKIQVDVTSDAQYVRGDK